MSDRQGRLECPNCGSFATEFKLDGYNYKLVECLDCEDTFKHYLGRECRNCGSRNTRERKKRGTFAPYEEVICNDCGDKYRV